LPITILLLLLLLLLLQVVNGYGYTWVVTFLSEVGPLALMTADGSGLAGPSAAVTVSRGSLGVMPDDYDSMPGLPASTSSFRIERLTTGVPTYVRVRAGGREGLSAAAVPAVVKLAPLAAPTAPQNVQLIVMSDSMIKVRVSVFSKHCCYSQST
jgi:hypothetical protein